MCEEREHPNICSVCVYVGRKITNQITGLQSLFD